MLLVADTETSGLWRDELDPLDPSQPHMVQLGAQLFDLQYRRRGHLNVLIKPEGWEIETEAADVHGITTQSCHRYGISLIAALATFQGMVACSSRIIGHHIEFDRKIIAAAIHRAGGTGVWWARCGSKMFCTMEAATPVLKIQGDFGDKFPTLEEAVTRLSPETPKPSHDADTDIGATIAVYRALIDGGHAAQVAPFGVQI